MGLFFWSNFVEYGDGGLVEGFFLMKLDGCI